MYFAIIAGDYFFSYNCSKIDVSNTLLNFSYAEFSNGVSVFVQPRFFESDECANDFLKKCLINASKLV